jgi:hypothetical protein
MHGKYPCSLDEKFVDNERSYRWMKFRDIKGETESTIWQPRIRHSVQTALGKKF